MTMLLTKAKLALRNVGRSPGFALLAVVVLSVSIGSGTVVFSLLDAVLLRDLPFAQANRLIEISGRSTTRSGMRVPSAIAETIRSQARTIQQLSYHSPVSGVFKSPDGLLDLRGDTVSANFMDVLGVRPVAGRTFVSADEHENAAPVVVVSFSFAQRHFGEPSGAVDRTIQLGDTTYTIVGVMPPSFRTAFRGLAKDYWTTYKTGAIRELELRSGYEIVARLAAGASLPVARAELSDITTRSGLDGWSINSQVVTADSLKDEVVRDSALAIKLLFGAVGIVILTACSNLAQLLLARSAFRSTEFATHKALGASNADLFSLVLLENIALAGMGALGGAFIANLAIPVAKRLAPGDIPRLAEATMDANALLFAACVALIAGVLFGVLPALRLARSSPIELLRETRGSTGTAQWATVAIAIQIAAATTLVILAILVAQSFRHLVPTSPGFEAADRAAFILYLPPRQFPTVDQRLDRLSVLKRSVEDIQGVSAVSMASNVPFSGDHIDSLISESSGNNSELGRADVRAVTSNYFSSLGISMVAGRPFSEHDSRNAEGVVILNEAFARQLRTRASDVVGMRLRVRSSATQPEYRVVGVVSDTRSLGTTVKPLNEVYIPQEQSDASLTYLIVKSTLPANLLTEQVQQRLRSTMPNLPLREDFRAEPLERLLSQSVAAPRFSLVLLGMFAGIVQGLAALAVFGFVAYSIAYRRREFEIRSALGATPSRLLREAAFPVLVTSLGGIAVGIVAGGFAAKALRSQLYGIEPLDPDTFVSAAVLMTVVCCCTAIIPALAATRPKVGSMLRS